MVTIIAPRNCIVCGEFATLEVTEDERLALETTRFIQDALPERTPAERELLISGTHGACWDSLFADED